jgi:hypothetical protein
MPPEVDQISRGCRTWRLFVRALVVIGATAVGTSAAWLLGAGASTADPLALPGVPGVTLSKEDGARSEPGQHLVDPASLRLRELDPAALLPVKQTTPLTAVVQQARPTLEPVERAANTLLPAPVSLPETVDSGLRKLGRPLWQVVNGGTDQRPQIPAPPVATPLGDHSVPEPARADAPPLIAAPLASSDVSPALVADSGRASPGGSDLPTAPRPLPVPAPAPGPVGCGGHADGPGPGGFGIGGHAGAEQFPDQPSAFPTRGSSRVPVCGPGSQPGTTPD